MATTEEQFVAARWGKWGEAGVPHKGWVCIAIEDLGEPELTCEMCETTQIRYVHHMEHGDYPEVLQVGCICAGHMQQDLAAARARDASMKSRASKRKRWLSRTWRMSAKDNPTLKADGYRITVYARGTGFGATIAPLDGTPVIHARQNYPTKDHAKLAAFDHITRLLANSY